TWIPCASRSAIAGASGGSAYSLTSRSDIQTIRQSTLERGHPAVLVGLASRLHARDGVEQPRRDLARLAVVDQHVLALPAERAHRRDDRGGAAAEHLAQLAAAVGGDQLLHPDRPLVRGKAPVA